MGVVGCVWIKLINSSIRIDNMVGKTPNGNGRVAITLSLKGDLLKDFRNYCEHQGFLLSGRIEALMRKELERRGELPPPHS